jgi:hypothetical protein
LSFPPLEALELPLDIAIPPAEDIWVIPTCLVAPEFVDPDSELDEELSPDPSFPPESVP